MKYFVSYQTPEKVGYCVLNLGKPVVELEDLNEMCNIIKEGNQYSSNVVLLNWRRMEQPE